MLLIPIILVSVVLIGHNIYTKNTPIPACEILSYGVLVDEEPIEILSSTEVFSGKIRRYRGINIPVNSTKIEIKPGLRFGLEHAFGGVPKGEKVKEVLTHPIMIRPDGNTIREQVLFKNPTDSGSSYGFDQVYEQVAGVWKFEYSYKGSGLCSQTFNVVSVGNK